MFGRHCHKPPTNYNSCYLCPSVLRTLQFIKYQPETENCNPAGMLYDIYTSPGHYALRRWHQNNSSAHHKTLELECWHQLKERHPYQNPYPFGTTTGGENLPETHPFGPKTLLISVHTVHLDPWTSGLHTQRPVICSQSSLTEPNSEHPQARNEIFSNFTSTNLHLHLKSVDLRKHPGCPDDIFGNPQNPGSHLSHFKPPTPGLHLHWPVSGSQASE